MLAGRAAEELVFGAEEVSSGAASDISRATELAAQMTLELGMRGRPINLRALGLTGGAEAAALIDESYAAARDLLRQNAARLALLTEALLREEALDEAQLREVLGR